MVFSCGITVYLLWTWTILFLPQRSLLPTIITFIGIAPLPRFIGEVVGVNQVAIWILTQNSFYCLCLGALLAYFSYHEYELHILKKHIIYFFLVLGLLMTVTLQILPCVDSNSLVMSTLADTGRGLIFTYLVAAAANGFKGFVGKALEYEPVIYLGKISYGIYLIHVFMPDIAYRILDRLDVSYDRSSLVIAGLSTVSTIIIASISWRILEKPMNDLKRFFHYAA